jgi:hypothetical protein
MSQFSEIPSTRGINIGSAALLDPLAQALGQIRMLRIYIVNHVLAHVGASQPRFSILSLSQEMSRAQQQ